MKLCIYKNIHLCKFCVNDTCVSQNEDFFLSRNRTQKNKTQRTKEKSLIINQTEVKVKTLQWEVGGFVKFTRNKWL